MRRRLTSTTGRSPADAPKGRGSERLRSDLERRAPLTLRPRIIIIRRGQMPRAFCGIRVPLCVRLNSILMRTALQNVWSFRERARLARRNSVSTRLIAFSAPSRARSSSTRHPRTRVRTRCSSREGEGVKSLWRSILDMRIKRVRKG